MPCLSWMALRELVEKHLATRSAAEWEALFNEKGVPAGLVLTIPEILAHPQIHERHFIESLESENAKGEKLRITRPGFRLSEEFPAPVAPPVLGADTHSWLQRLGVTEEEIEKLNCCDTIRIADGYKTTTV